MSCQLLILFSVHAGRQRPVHRKTDDHAERPSDGFRRTQRSDSYFAQKLHQHSTVDDDSESNRSR